jgi:hypothetical protein
LTGRAAANASARLTRRLHQNRPSRRPAAIAPGTRRMKRLSTISIVSTDSVSEATASGTARRGATPARTTERKVST